MPLPTRSIFFLTATLAAAGAVTLLSGCKGNTTSAAILEKAVAPPPSITAMPSAGNPASADPLTELPWVGTRFSPFVSPLNTDRSTPASRAALLYDASTLYVAFVSDTATAAADQDVVSVYLDPSAAGNGTKLVQVSVRHTGQASATWMYSSEAATKREDGSPNLTHPLVTIPNVEVAGLTVKTRDAQEHGHRVWTAVVGIPLKGLPLPLQAMPQPGSHWKVNLIRTVAVENGGGGRQVLQSNFSPVYVGAQAVSPYRMAELFLSPGQMTASR